ncbi:MAG: guanylate kinase [Candidatus Berkelbacteria bacterium]
MNKEPENLHSQFPLIISGVAGSGKSSVVSKLKDFPDKFALSVSYTTRRPRAGETNGVDYNYISNEEFEAAIQRGEFLEWENVHTDKYGTKKADFEKIMHDGKVPVLTIDVKGAENIKKMYKNALLVFIMPPTLEEALKRVQKRGAETAEEVAVRVARFNLETSYKDKYDYTIVNDVLETAQNRLIEIVSLEEEKRKGHHLSKTTKAILISVISLIFLSAGLAQAYLYQQNQQRAKDLALQSSETITGEIDLETSGTTAVQTGSVATTGAVVATTGQAAKAPAPAKVKVAPPTPAAKAAVIAEPPKHETPAAAPIVEATKTNTDGSTTTVIATAEGAKASDIKTVTDAAPATINTPYDIVYSDETGLYPDLEKTLKDYLNGVLKWRNEISSMKKITVRDAGDTGWTGQYLGGYTMAADGKDITAASGTIILNTYYYKDSPYFSDYMKLVLSHEYGHHYTLYHKWVDWDLTISDRFPDSYYTVRPLSKATTATDYSLGWENCEAEIIAEDYSYLYSGYGWHGMKDTYGYPSAGTKVWLDKIGDPSLLTSNIAPIVDTEKPVVTVVSPTTNPYTLENDNLVIDVTATDNIAVKKIEIYLDDQLRNTYTGGRLRLTADFTGYGTYNLKFRAYDDAGNSADAILTILRSAPVVTPPSSGAALSGTAVGSGEVTSGTTTP